MFSLTVITGRLTRDPVQGKPTASNAVPVDFTVAVEEGYKDRKTVHYFNCTAWGKLGENMMAYQKKGSLVTVTGKMLSSKNEDRIYWKLRADDVVFLSSSADKNNSPQQNSQPQSAQPTYTQPPAQPSYAQPTGQQYAQAPSQPQQGYQQPQQGYQQPQQGYQQPQQGFPPAQPAAQSPSMFPDFPTDDDLPF